MNALNDWAEYEHKVAIIVAEMQGAGKHFEDNPEYATDAVVADAFRRYLARLREVQLPSRAANAD